VEERRQNLYICTQKTPWNAKMPILAQRITTRVSILLLPPPPPLLLQQTVEVKRLELRRRRGSCQGSSTDWPQKKRDKGLGAFPPGKENGCLQRSVRNNVQLCRQDQNKYQKEEEIRLLAERRKLHTCLPVASM
jgi:hypothetical protein